MTRQIQGNRTKSRDVASTADILQSRIENRFGPKDMLTASGQAMACQMPAAENSTRIFEVFCFEFV